MREDLHGKKSQYYFACGTKGRASAYYDMLVKQDLDTGAHLSWHVPGHYPAEPLFVPDPAGQREDDGVVVTNVLDVVNNQTYVIVLDAVTMTTRAKVGPAPRVIPHGFHGAYFPD